MEVANLWWIIGILLLGGTAFYFLRKSQSNNSYRSFSDSKKRMEVSSNFVHSDKTDSKISENLTANENSKELERANRAETLQKSEANNNRNITLVESQNQQLTISPDQLDQLVEKIVKMADNLYSDIDLTVYDLNTRGKIEKIIASVRAKHHPLYKSILFSKDELRDDIIDSFNE